LGRKLEATCKTNPGLVRDEDRSKGEALDAVMTKCFIDSGGYRMSCATNLCGIPVRLIVLPKGIWERVSRRQDALPLLRPSRWPSKMPLPHSKCGVEADGPDNGPSTMAPGIRLGVIWDSWQSGLPSRGFQIALMGIGLGLGFLRSGHGPATFAVAEMEALVNLMLSLEAQLLSVSHKPFPSVSHHLYAKPIHTRFQLRLTISA
jgi:hypothetical protein